MSRLLILAGLIGCSAALGIALVSARRARRGRERPIEVRLGELERLRGLELISEQECENCRTQILQEI